MQAVWGEMEQFTKFYLIVKEGAYQNALKGHYPETTYIIFKNKSAGCILCSLYYQTNHLFTLVDLSFNGNLVFCQHYSLKIEKCLGCCRKGWTYVIWTIATISLQINEVFNCVEEAFMLILEIRQPKIHTINWYWLEK